MRRDDLSPGRQSRGNELVLLLKLHSWSQEAAERMPATLAELSADDAVLRLHLSRVARDKLRLATRVNCRHRRGGHVIADENSQIIVLLRRPLLD